MRKSYLFVLIALVLFSFTSCKEKREEVIEFDKSHPLALAPDVTWAVITDPYAAYKKQVDWNGEISGHCRKGDILQVLGSSKDKDNQTWYEFEGGWLPDNCLMVYSNRYKAQSVSNKLKEN